MTVFIIRRLFSLILTLLGGYTLLFLLFFTLPSDPAEVISGGLGRNPPKQVVENTRERLGLDKPIYVQYWDRLEKTVTLSDHSFLKPSESVGDMVKARLPASLRLAIWAMLIEASVGISSGVLSARRRNSFADAVTTTGAVVAGAIPVFVLGYLLQLLTGVLPFQHHFPSWAHLPTISTDYDPTKWFLFVPSWSQVSIMIQPALVLASVSTAIVARLTRTTMLEAQTADHVRTARAKGLREKQVSRRHVLRNALIPVVTFIGIDFGTIIGFAILTETVFQWPGLGSRVAQAAEHSDLPVVLSLSMVVMLVYGLANLVVDVSYAKLDPRIRLGGAA